MIYYVIPARKNSKGFRYKNRFLFEQLPPDLKNENVIITSDDEVIEQMNKDSYGFDFIKRPDNLAEDTTSIKPVLQHVVSEYNLKPEDTLVVLYLTYPERTYDDIKKIVSFYKTHVGKSLLCKEPVDLNLHNEETIFYDLGEHKIDVDNKTDLPS